MDNDYEPKEEEEEEDVETDGEDLWDDGELLHLRRHWSADILAELCRYSSTCMWRQPHLHGRMCGTKRIMSVSSSKSHLTTRLIVM